jgi:hypothetical protein
LTTLKEASLFGILFYSIIKFSFSILPRKTHAGPLDMRMNVHSGEFTAADVVNNLNAEELAEIIETVNFSFLFSFRILHLDFR